MKNEQASVIEDNEGNSFWFSFTETFIYDDYSIDTNIALYIFFLVN